jgi:hypothetical protein
MTITIAKDKSSWPKPSPGYAQLAASWRAAGLDVKDDEFEKIDAILTGEKWNGPEKRNQTSQDYDVDLADIFGAQALRDSGYMSQDTPSPDLLIDGYLPRTKPFLMN